MLRIKIKRLWWACVAAIALYPISARAQDSLPLLVLPAPFLIDWSGIWLFALGGGVCSAFVKMKEIDKRFHYPAFAKFLIGTFSGVGISLFIETFINTSIGFLTFFALFASLFSAPIAAGGMAWLSDQRRIDKALDGHYKQKTGIDVSLDDEEVK